MRNKVYTTVDNKVIGDCSVDGTDIPTGAKLISKSRTDYGNKQGPICFVGQFGDNAEATACTIGKVCQVNNCRKHFKLLEFFYHCYFFLNHREKLFKLRLVPQSQLVRAVQSATLVEIHFAVRLIYAILIILK